MELTKNELEIIEILWGAGRPLTGTELIGRSSETKSWKSSSLHTLLNSLLKKKAIREAGFVSTGKGYGRTFLPTVSAETYYAEHLAEMAKRTDPVKVLAALINAGKVSDETISELEALLKAHRGRQRLGDGGDPC